MLKSAPALALSFALLPLAAGTASADPRPPARGGASDARPSAPPPATVERGKPAEETIDQILARGQQAPPPSVDQPTEKAPPPPVEDKGNKAAASDKAANAVVAATRAPARPAKADEPPAPITDDNDTTAEAVRPKALEAVAPATRPRAMGAYELGALDCRMLDGAGIERILPKKMIAGEEPDLLCRVLVTQPATVAMAAHTLTLTVSVGGKATYQQARTIRMSSVGRRSVVFVVPADRISSEDAATVAMRAVLSAPAKPPTREVKFVVEPAD
jgi:hypothetical protein